MKKRKEFNSGIYLLPNILTTSSLFAAFYSLVSCLKGNFEAAGIAIFIGFIADGLDGRIARLTNTQTAFGAEYDSLSDMVTFGVAPGILLYTSGLFQLGKLGWIVSFIFVASVALRLARFNTQIEHVDKKYFQGLSCPAGAGLIAAYVWLLHNPNSMMFATGGLIIALIISVLMVSNIRYYSFKVIDRKKVPFLYVLLMLLIFVAIAMNPALVLFIVGIVYVISGPLQTLLTLRKMHILRKKDI